MAEQDVIENKIKQSKLETIDLQKFYPETTIVEFDLKDFLYEGLVLKEKDFREALDEHEWSQYEGQYLAVHCSTDAIVASWAYMLVAEKAFNHARDVLFGTEEDILFELYRRKLEDFDWSDYEGKFVLLKGCSDKPVPESVYMHATKKLIPHVGKLMYGEACSSVPVYRKPRGQ